MTVYWQEPTPDRVCEEVGDGVILIKNPHTEEVIGFKRLYYRSGTEANTLTVETLLGSP